MNHVRVKFIRYELAEKLGRPAAYCDDYIKGLNVLDVGCRGGLLSESLARLGAKVTGIDPSPHNIEIAEWHSKQDCATYDINYIHTSVDQIADEEKKFDVVCSLEVFVFPPFVFICCYLYVVLCRFLNMLKMCVALFLLVSSVSNLMEVYFCQL